MHSERRHEPLRPRIAHSANPPQAGQSQAFDQLLTQLTGPQLTGPQLTGTQLTGPRPPAAEAGQAAAPPSLTPPSPGQPNPFAVGSGR